MESTNRSVTRVVDNPMLAFLLGSFVESANCCFQRL